MDNKTIREALAVKERYDINDLLLIMEQLRAPDGCPWDREQTHESIRKDLIEETYEAAEAIDMADPEMLREELGDVLLQVVFHSRLSQESGEFDFGDVVHDICAKLVLRHPHIFSDVKVKDTGEVLTNWDNIKQASHGRTLLSEKLEGVSRALPALMRADKLVRKAAKENVRLTDATENPNLTHEEAGQRLLFAAAEAALAGIDPERALADACDRAVAVVKNREKDTAK